MNSGKEDLIDFAVMMILFAGVAAAGATILAAEINQIFTYISTRLAVYTTQNHHLVVLMARQSPFETTVLGRFLCETRF